MENAKIKGIIEAILFASGKSISIRELELAIEIDKEQIIRIISEMQEEYKMQERGVEIIKINNEYTLSSKSQYHEYIYSVIDKRAKPSLSQAALEVLAIIAYNSKITRAEIDLIRGVSSDASIYRLLEHNLIQEAGKLELPGKPMAYKVTEDFLKKFGLNTIDDLPELPKYKMDENRQIVIEKQEDEKKEENILHQEEGEECDKQSKVDNEP